MALRPFDADSPPSVLIIDDEEDVREILVRFIRSLGWKGRSAANGAEGLEAIFAEPPDLVVCDLCMPKVDGMGIVEAIKGDPETRSIPVVLLTGYGDSETMVQALGLGADDMLHKPVEFGVLEARLRNLLKLKAYTDQLENAEVVLLTLAETIEARDRHTGRHCERLASFSATLGRSLGVPASDLDALRKGGYLHDVGKIGVPDSILLKPGRLTDEEWEIVRGHPVIGHRLCKPLKSMRDALPIILHHHERWDGKGYPAGLCGEAIPLTARILQVVDAYDALRSRRPYKPSLPKEEAFAILEQEAGSGKWDPRIVRALTECLATGLPLERTYEDSQA